MGFFRDLWDGAVAIGKGIGKVLGAVIDVLIEGAFWLVEKVFDAVNALFDFIGEIIDDIVELVGSFFTSDGKDGEVIILPPTPEVVEIIGKYDKEYGTDYHRKAQEGKGTLAVVEDGNGKVQASKIAGSERGFDSQISAVHKRKRSFATKIKNK